MIMLVSRANARAKRMPPRPAHCLSFIAVLQYYLMSVFFIAWVIALQRHQIN